MGQDETPALPEPTWRATSRASAAPRLPLTRDTIVEATLRVLDREGLEKLSMRLVSEELGTGPASIYWHVRNKDELLHLVAEQVAAGVRMPEPDPSRWPEQLKDFARQMRAVMNSHRDVARISMGRIPFGPTVAHFTEWLYQLLSPAGVPDRAIAYVGDLFGLYVGAHSFEESLGITSPTGEDLSPEQILQMYRDYMSSLPTDRFPNVQRVLEHLFDTDSDARFEFGIDILVRGLQAYAAPTQPPAPQRDSSFPESG